MPTDPPFRLKSPEEFHSDLESLAFRLRLSRWIKHDAIQRWERYMAEGRCALADDTRALCLTATEHEGEAWRRMCEVVEENVFGPLRDYELNALRTCAADRLETWRRFWSCSHWPEEERTPFRNRLLDFLALTRAHERFLWGGRLN